MKTMKKRFALGLAAAMVLGLFTGVTEAEAASNKYVKKLSVSKSSVTLKEGTTMALTSKVTVKGKANKKITAKTSNKKIVSVSVKAGKSGKSTINLTGKKAGTATITVKTKAKNKKNKVLSKKIKVTVVASAKNQTTQQPTTQQPTTQQPTKEQTTTPALSVIMTEKSVDVKIGATYQLTAKVYPEKNCSDKVSWSSSNTAIATVSQTGLVKAGNTEGECVITATAGKYKASCNVRVYKPFCADDYKVEQIADKTVHIEFKAKDQETANLYKNLPEYTVDGLKVSGDIACEAYTYTFTKLPTTLDDIKQIKLNNACAPLAAMICAIHTVDTNVPYTTFATVQGNTLLPMFNYLGGKECNLLDSSKTAPLLHAQFLANQMILGGGGDPNLKNCYFEGATPENGYTPTIPYKLTMYVGPYYIKATKMLDGKTRPETYMAMIEFAGDDSARYIDVYHSKDSNWYGLNSSPYETFKQLMAKPKPVNLDPEW